MIIWLALLEQPAGCEGSFELDVADMDKFTKLS